MKATLSARQRTGRTTRNKTPGLWQRDSKSATSTVARPLFLAWVLLIMAAILLLPLPAPAQDHGSGHGGGGGGGCGDVFGDLMHILRDDVTGQPIFAQRWVELPASVPGYGWGYCPIALDEAGAPIQFMPYSCDLDPLFAHQAVEVDYFGRLNGGRTKERNNRMHFDEVISNIKQAGQLKLGPDGRLMMGFGCELDADPGTCLWSTVDSPMEAMGLYSRTMKYGHIATHPYEVNDWAHGDPKLGTQFHPALSEADWAKFADPSLANLLPRDTSIDGDPRICWQYTGEPFTDSKNTWNPDKEKYEANGIYDPSEPFMDINKDGIFNPDPPRPEPYTDVNGNGVWDAAEEYNDVNENGVWDALKFKCADPEPLDNADFMSSSVALATAAPKTGKITVDLIQYFNRFLKITQETGHTASTLLTLPAQYLDCWDEDANGQYPDDPAEDEVLVDDLVYDAVCVIKDAQENIDNYDIYPNIQEQFMDFSSSAYQRSFRPNTNADVILESSQVGTWGIIYDQPLMEWAARVHPELVVETNIHNFRRAATDALLMIEYIHNYSIPDDLVCTRIPDECD